MSIQGKLKVGVIGVGGIAGAHFAGWKEGQHTELAAMADLCDATLKRVGAQHGVSKLYSSPEELIEDDDIDIVDICTPNMYHAPLAQAAMEAGKHVICEKPLAPTPEEIQRLIETRDRTGMYLMTAQHMRFEGSTTALKAEIEAGRLGHIYHTRAWMLRRAAVPIRPTFLLKEHSGGGPCIDIGVHILDLTLWMMGHPEPVAVSGVTVDKIAHQPGAFSIWGGRVPAEMDVEEFAAGFVRFVDGQTLILEVSWLLHHDTHGHDGDMQIWLYGENGGAHWPSNTLLSSNNKNQQFLNASLLRQDAVAPHAEECRAFAEAIMTGLPSPVPAEQSLQVQRILDGLYRSAAEGREVRL